MHLIPGKSNSHLSLFQKVHVTHDLLVLQVLLVFSMTLAGWDSWQSKASGKGPNFVIILADDMGFSDLGCYGGDVASPNLDQLAANGLRFTQFYNTARCWPTRSCIMTGYYAQQVRMDPPKGRLPAWALTLPKRLQGHGYHSYHAGKWHVNGAPRVVADGGFEHSYRLADHDRFFSPKNTQLDDVRLPEVPRDSGYYTTTEIVNRGIGFLQQHQQTHGDAPFFLYVAFNSPHFPLHALPEDIAKYERKFDDGWDVVRQRRYERLSKLGIINTSLSAAEPQTRPNWNLDEAKLQEEIGPGESGSAVPWTSLNSQQQRFQAIKMAIHTAMVDRIDQEVGRLFGQLKSMGAWDDTVIFVLSDNGASAEQLIRGDMNDKSASPGSAGSYLCLGPGWSTACNTPFRRHKTWVNEGGISTPLIVHWPVGISARGELRRQVGHVIDLVPTCMELAGIDEQPSSDDAPPLPGHSLAAAIREDEAVDRDYVFFHHQGSRALRMGNWKIVNDKNEETWQLYNLENDRAESQDLAELQPDRVREMSNKWQSLEQQFRRQAGE